jgi:hypothetical protein
MRAVPDTYPARADEAERDYIKELGLGPRQAVAFIDSRELRDLPWGVRGHSAVRRTMRTVYGSDYFEKQPGSASSMLPDGWADDPV